MKSEKIEQIVDIAATLASRADEIDQVLVIYRCKTGDSQFSLDNNLTLSESLWLVEGFRFWLQAGAMGLLKKVNDE